MIGEKEDEDDNNEEDECPTDEQVYESVDTLTSSDIEFLRAAVVEGDESASGRTPFKDGLKGPPKRCAFPRAWRWIPCNEPRCH